MDRYRSDLLSMPAAELGDHHAAEEAVQEPFLRRYGLLCRRTVTRAWFFRAALWRTHRVR